MMEKQQQITGEWELANGEWGMRRAGPFTNSYPLFSILALFVLTSCTKEIELPLQDESNKVVIEAAVVEGPGPHTVRLSRSVPFTNNNTFPAVQGATVTLSDDQGNSEQLTETSPGTYATSTLQGVVGRTYHLSTTVDGTTYIAACRMPTLVPLDTLRIDSLPLFGGNPKVVYAVCSDPAGEQNNYRYITRVNGTLLPGVRVQNDRLENGSMMDQPVNLGSNVALKPGDQVEVAMQCIAPEVYRYFFALSQSMSGNSSAPADPPTNISGGALGYFSAYTASTRTLVVP
ncbi:MAG: DUF4249 domain-containing protein [Bacteroidetes bacterium]|nr:DUF4249 domain-containing protein [Bacteroidota bacterium]